MRRAKHFISWFARNDSEDRKLQLWGTQAELAELTAGLSLHALMQLLKGVRHGRVKLSQEEVVAKVEGFIKSQLGEEVVEFKKPGHSLNDVIGFKRLKTFLKKEVIPRFGMDSGEALPGAAIGGPIGAGKTFIFEAVAAELDMVVLVIKNIRSKYYGEDRCHLRAVAPCADGVVTRIDFYRRSRHATWRLSARTRTRRSAV